MPDPRARSSAREALRLALRIALGFAVFALLLVPWLGLGLHAAYERGIARGAARLLEVSHFPLGSASPEPLQVYDEGYGLVLIVAMLFVSTRTSWRARTASAAALVLLVVSSQIAARALQLHLAVGLDFERNTGVPLLLPWEIAVEARLFRLLHAFGLQIAPFGAVVLAAAWSAGPALAARLERDGTAPAVRAAPGRRKGSPRRRRLLAAAVAALALAAVTAAWLRERDPRHVRAHIILAENFYARRQFDLAAEQYGAATRGGARDGHAWFRLVTLLECGGRSDAAAAGLRRALRVVEDPVWVERLRAGPQAIGCPERAPAGTARDSP